MSNNIKWVESVNELPSFRYILDTKRGMTREQVEALAATVDHQVTAFERVKPWAVLAVYG